MSTFPARNVHNTFSHQSTWPTYEVVLSILHRWRRKAYRWWQNWSTSCNIWQKSQDLNLGFWDARAWALSPKLGLLKLVVVKDRTSALTSPTSIVFKIQWKGVARIMKYRWLLYSGITSIPCCQPHSLLCCSSLAKSPVRISNLPYFLEVLQFRRNLE